MSKKKKKKEKAKIPEVWWEILHIFSSSEQLHKFQWSFKKKCNFLKVMKASPSQ